MCALFVCECVLLIVCMCVCWGSRVCVEQLRPCVNDIWCVCVCVCVSGECVCERGVCVCARVNYCIFIVCAELCVC